MKHDTCDNRRSHEDAVVAGVDLGGLRGAARILRDRVSAVGGVRRVGAFRGRAPYGGWRRAGPARCVVATGCRGVAAGGSDAAHESSRGRALARRLLGGFSGGACEWRAGRDSGDDCLRSAPAAALLLAHDARVVAGARL